MRRILLTVLLISAMILPVKALELPVPEAPEAAQEMLAEKPDSFSEGLLAVIRKALPKIAPAFSESIKICAAMTGICLLLSLADQLPGRSSNILHLCAALVLGTAMFGASKSLVALGTDTVAQISEYGKLLLPVLTAALTAEGGITAATALYTGTAFFNSLLSTAVSAVMIPMIYVYLCVSISAAAADAPLLEKMKELIKWLMTWFLKIVLYVFTGYIGITGVVSGSTDAAALKATKLTISGTVPVVGNILADASEAVLVGAGVVKNAAGIYGLLVVLALWISPFIQMGTQYLLVKGTAGSCAMFSSKKVTQIIFDFSTVLGLLAAMTGAVCLMQLISIVCFMRGVG